MKHTILTLIFLSLWFAGAGQKIELKTVIDSAMANYPLSRQNKIYSQKTDLEIKMIKNTNLPQAELTGRATYQNEVISLPITIPIMDIPELDNEQYKLQLEISQAIYKGGLTRAQKALSQTNNLINNKQTEVELNKVKYEVIRIYYEVLLTDQLKNVSLTYHNTLSSKLKEMQALIENGALLSSAADAVKAEKLTIEQKITSFEIRKNYLLRQLQTLSGIKFTKNSKFVLPAPDINPDATQQRPEYELLTLQKNKLEAMKDISSAKAMPKAFAFSTLGYGRPGFNYLSNDFSFYALVGVGISWNLWNWNKYKNERNILELNSKLTDYTCKSFIVNLNEKLLEIKAEIETQNEMLKKAEEIIVLRKSVMETTDRQHKNGTITTSRYINELQNYEKARLDAEVYKIKLSIAKTNYLWALGRI